MKYYHNLYLSDELKEKKDKIIVIKIMETSLK